MIYELLTYISSQSPSSFEPLTDIITSKEAILLSVGLIAVTGAVKNAAYIWAGENKERIKWVKGVFLPLIPLTLGAIAALVFRIVPEGFEQYIISRNLNIHTSLIVYGAIIGQFADYSYQRANGLKKMKSPDQSNESES